MPGDMQGKMVIVGKYAIKLCHCFNVNNCHLLLILLGEGYFLFTFVHLVYTFENIERVENANKWSQVEQGKLIHIYLYKTLNSYWL